MIKSKFKFHFKLWVFGITERFSRKVYFECVPRRTKKILLKIIEDRVEPESVIISDSWRAYLGK